jgi:hypothetical protein
VRLTSTDFAESISFSSTQRLAGTYYFYWYNARTREHVIDDDGTDALTDHPATLDDFSYASVRWHKKELNDMIAAGIDVALPVFWGAPSEQNAGAQLHWSYAGLKPLVQAREELLREGKTPPRLGLFYDTSTLRYNAWHEHVDLTTGLRPALVLRDGARFLFHDSTEALGDDRRASDRAPLLRFVREEARSERD